MNICNLEATDENGDSITFAISGTDAGDLIVVDNSILKFKNNPDFENPLDNNTNNIYEFTIKVSDGTININYQLQLRVLNIEENQLSESTFGLSKME